MSGFILWMAGACLAAGLVDFQASISVSIFLFSLLFTSVEIIEKWLFCDMVSSPVLSISILVSIISIMGSFFEGWNRDKIFLLFSSVSIVGFYFLSKSLVLMFITFELSLIPMLVLILSWGSNPERILASKYMTLYTMVASAPLLFEILSMESVGLSVESSIFPSILHGENTAVLFCMVAFLTKIPLFMFHSWLPRAHVEAPLVGSMVLAGVMLKVGVYGFIRMIPLTSFNCKMSNWVYSLSLLGSVYSICAALSSDDLKTSVAFSSVSHMNLCVAAICTGSQEGLMGGVISMVSHGLISPLLFFNVTIMYKISHSRSVLVNKGLGGKLPQLWAFSLALWSGNMGIPPFLSFIGELKQIGSIIFHTQSVVLAALFVTLGSVFMVWNYGILNHSGSKIQTKGSISLTCFQLGTVVCMSFAVAAFFMN